MKVLLGKEILNTREEKENEDIDNNRKLYKRYIQRNHSSVRKISLKLEMT